MPGDIFSRINLSPNIDFTFSPKVTAGTSIHLSYRENTSKSNERALQYAINGDPLGRIHDLDGTPRFSVSTDGYEINPMADYLWDSYRESNKGWSTFLNAYVQVKITPDLTYRVNLGTNFSLRSNGESSGFHSIANNLGLPTANVSAEVRNFKSYESILTYDKEFNNTDHHLTITAVQGVQSSRTENNGADVRDLPYENSRFYNIGSAN